jgi:ATP/maltotriose-dependent transcriptional regulator MalT
VEPAAGMSLRYARAGLELARGRDQEAQAAFRDAEELAATLVRPHTGVTSMRSRMLQTLVRLGQADRAEQAHAELGEDAPAPPVTREGLGEIVPPAVTEQLTDSELRVLRYLPTPLTTHEIASELFVSENTVGTHRRHLYAKLGVHSRHQAVERARALGLLAPSARRA